MGRRSLSGLPPRTRTVDDDLADNNLTRQDLAVGEYAFKCVWSHLRAHGWYAKPGPPLSYDHFYIKPGKSLADGVEGVDYFYGEANLCAYAVNVHLFESAAGQTDETVAPSRLVSTTSETHAGSGSSEDTRSQARVNQSTPTAPTSSAAMASNGSRTTPSPTVKSEGDAMKQEGGKAQSKGKRKLKASAEIEPRQWPESHRRKGAHAADAICIDSDSDDEEKSDEDHVPKRLGNPGKRKATPRIEDDDDEVDDDGKDGNDDGFEGGDDASVGTVESDATGYSAASTETSSTSKRPLLTTRVTKRQKVKVAATEKKMYKAPGPMMAYKRKSAPRGLMFQGRSIRDILDEASPVIPPVAHDSETLTPNRRPTSPDGAETRHARELPKPSVAHGLESQFNATIKEEPPAYSPPTPPPRPPSRASSVASSQRSVSMPRSSASETLLSQNSSIPRASVTETVLEVEGVAFPSRPTERYRVLITRDTSSGETTIWMEEQTSFQQRQLSFTNITSFSAAPVPEHAIHRALCCSLVALSENVVVQPPSPPESKCSSTSNDASSVDYVRDESSDSVQLRFPDSSIWTVLHTFPMETVAEGRLVRALRDELSRANEELHANQTQLRTTQEDLETARAELESVRGGLRTADRELETTRSELQEVRAELEIALRDRDAFKRQHEHLEKEYQKLRAAQDHAKQHLQQTYAQPQTRAPSPSPPKARAQPKARTQPPPRVQSQPQAKTIPHPQPPIRVLPQPQPKSPSHPQAKAQQTPPKSEEKPHARQHQQKSPVRAHPSTPSPAKSITSAAFTPSSSGPRVFHAQGKWLDSTFPKCPSGSPWVVRWNKVITVSPTHFAITADNGISKEVSLNVSGSYQLTMIVSHASTMLLSVVITTASSGVRRVSFHPQLIQVCPAANGSRYISHFTQTIQCSVNDSVFAELRPCSETDPLSGKVERLEKFSPPPNDWRIEWKNDHAQSNGTVNGK